MTFDVSILKDPCLPVYTTIFNANGVPYPVTGAGRVDLEHTLLVPSLSNNFLSAAQVTAQLNCLVLIYPTFCLLQDLGNGEIIGRGTKRDGLYYIDDVCEGRSLSVKRSSCASKNQILLWHRRLGHAFFWIFGAPVS